MTSSTHHVVPVVLALLLSLGACTNIIVEGVEEGAADDSESGESGESGTEAGETGGSTAGEGYCGDAVCGPDEDCESCALDCGACETCGDGTCAGAETCETCPADCPLDECGEGPSCGDGQCEPTESCERCPQDCGECDVCGNGVCGNGETCGSCAEDCGECMCPCSEDPGIDNFCFYAPNTPECPMTAPGGYCDPNGDGSYDDGDWNQGYFAYLEQCG